jgi:membrane protease YdiL (CAAX protease family)
LWAWRSRTPWSDLGLRRPRSWILTIVLGVVLGVAFKLFMKSVLMPLLGAPPENPAFQFLRGNAAALPGMLLAVTLGAGLGEELVFRGFFFHRLEQLLGRGTPARIGIVLVTSLAFGLFHLPEQGVPGAEQAAISGLVMGTIYARSRNLWLPIFAHAAFDVVAVFIIYLGLEAGLAHLFFR